MLNGDLLLVITLSSQTIVLNLWYIVLHCFANGLAFARLRWLGRNRELYHHVDDDNDNLKKEKKKQLFLWAKQQLCTWSARFLVDFLDVHGTTTMWNHLTRRFMGDVNIGRRIFLSFFLNWINSSRIQLREKSPTFDKLELKLRRRRKRQKRKRFRLAKQQLWTCITLFCTFLCRHYDIKTPNFTFCGGR